MVAEVLELAVTVAAATLPPSEPVDSPDHATGARAVMSVAVSDNADDEVVTGVTRPIAYPVATDTTVRAADAQERAGCERARREK